MKLFVEFIFCTEHNNVLMCDQYMCDFFKPSFISLENEFHNGMQIESE